MALGTFGAIMGYAAEILRQTEEAYQGLIPKAKNPALKQVLQDLAGEEKKNQSLMERTRRENVTEMILEPITGLHQEEYGVDLTGMAQKDDGDLVKVALILEERAKRFFRDASAKVPLPEVARTFRRVGQKKEENVVKLQNLGLHQTLK
jgi:rubrerythrin